jgi:hypothetical protein
MNYLAAAMIGVLLRLPAACQNAISQTTVMTTRVGSTVTSTVAAASGSQAGNENYILRIHVEGRASYFRYTFHYTIDDAPGTNRQTRGMRDGWVHRKDDSNGNTEVFIPVGGKLKECIVYLIAEEPPRVR